MHTGATVHTSGREPDLFGDAPAPAVQACLQYQGELLQPARVAARAHDHGCATPVLVMELCRRTPTGDHFMHVEVPYPEHERAAAERRAASLQPGDTVTVTVPISSVRLSLLDASFSPTHTH